MFVLKRGSGALCIVLLCIELSTRHYCMRAYHHAHIIHTHNNPPPPQAREDDLEETVELTLTTRRELEELRSRFIQVLTENTSLKQQLGIFEAATGGWGGVGNVFLGLLLLY